MTENQTNKLDLLLPLLGEWTGEGRGFGSVSEVEQSYELILQDKFIRSQTKSIARDADGNVVDLHEDWGVFSYDPDRDVLMLREFYSEGYVNIYMLEEVEKDANRLVFTSVKTEGADGLLAKLRFDFLSDDDYSVSLDLAKPGEDFRECQIVRMNRKT